MAGGNHGGIGIRAAAIDDCEDPPVRIVTDLEVVLIDEGDGTEAESGQIVAGFRPATRSELRSVHEDQPDAEAPFDVERVPVDDPRHVALDTEAG